MSEFAIQAAGLGKQYRIGTTTARYQTMRESLSGLWQGPWRRLAGRVHRQREAVRGEQFWALREVSFDIRRGEVVGVIGHNGAGKSTLLKVLSRVTEPTEGEVALRGRVGSLLEVGTGFHPELTGRENVYLNGAILGMRREEIERKFDEIVSFAEVERFINTPVKHYSSGMYLRLAFAVAAHLEPEILLVDEVLAVGDIAFQGKCLAHMRRLSQKGITILFVSHNLVAVSDLCPRTLFFSRGQLALDAETPKVLAHYRRSLVDTSAKAAGASAYLRLAGLRLNGQEVGLALTHPPHQAAHFELVLDVLQPIYDAVLNLVVETPDGRFVVHLRSDVAGTVFQLPVGRQYLRVAIEDFPLAPGSYGLWFRLISTHPESGVVWDIEKIALEMSGFSPLEGVVWPRHSFEHRVG
jgi:lipopolysaccharide transport system ATP-binding protein